MRDPRRPHSKSLISYCTITSTEDGASIKTAVRSWQALDEMVPCVVYHATHGIPCTLNDLQQNVRDTWRLLFCHPVLAFVRVFLKDSLLVICGAGFFRGIVFWFIHYRCGRAPSKNICTVHTAVPLLPTPNIVFERTPACCPFLPFVCLGKRQEMESYRGV